MSPQSQLRHRFGNGRRPGTFSAWTMAIVFATVALGSFAIDQAIIPLPIAEDQSGFQPPSLLHPVLLIESLIDAAAASGDNAQ
jgi:hypothetical protein